MPPLPDDQFDYIQHPSLGRLGFPKGMPMEERNASIDRLLASPQPNLPGGTSLLQEAARGLPPNLTQPTKFEQDRRGATADMFSGSSDTGGGTLHNIRTSLLPSFKRTGPPANPDDYIAGPAGTGGITPQMGRQRFEAGEQSAENDAARAGAGRSGLYRGAATVNEGLGTANPVAMEKLADVGNKRGIVGQALGPMAVAAAPTVLRAGRQLTSGVRQGMAQKLIQPLVYEGVGEAGADARFGIEPDRGIVREGIWGTKKGMARQIEKRVGELKPAANSVLQNSPGSNQPIDAASHINAAIDEALETARQQGSPEMQPRLENLREALLTEHGPTSGTALSMNDLKSSIQDVASRLGAYKNTVPAEASAANAAGRAAFRIKNDVNTAVPEGTQMNERMADLMDARSGLNRSILKDKGTDLFGQGIEHVPTILMRRTIASAPVRSGFARLLTLGDKLDVPQVQTTPFAPPVPSQAQQTPFQPPPPSSQVGNLPTLGFPPTMPDSMWTGRSTPPAPTWEAPGRSVPSNAPGLQPAAVELQSPTSTVAPPSLSAVPSPQGPPPPSGQQPAAGTPAPSSTSAPPTLPPLPEPQPINPQEVADYSEMLGRPVMATEIPDIRRRLAAEQNVNMGLAGNRVDEIGNIREAHRAKLTRPSHHKR